MLAVDVSRRMTIPEIQMHPWFRKYVASVVYGCHEMLKCFQELISWLIILDMSWRNS